MQRQVILTRDGSHTVSIPDMHVTYHSIHGALQESMHVFIDAGLRKAMEIFPSTNLSVFEMGFGTGLNALLTLIEARKLNQTVFYHTIELFPLEPEEVDQLKYTHQLGCEDLLPAFEKMHESHWNKKTTISPFFTLNKSQSDLLALIPGNGFHVIYFDAFSPTTQPELWTKEVFEKLYSMLAPGGVLVTYCSKSIVRRAMQAAGFNVEKIQGPWGKREMLRASRKV